MSRVLFVLALASAIGCAQSDGPEARTSGEILTAQLARELVGGGAQLAPFVERVQGDPTIAELGLLASRDRATNRTLVDVTLTPPRDNLGTKVVPSAALFAIDAGGAIRLLARPAEGVVPNDVMFRRAVPGIGAIVSCTATDANGVRLDGENLVPFADAPGACRSSDVAGESLRAGRWLYLERSGATLVTVSRSVRGDAPETRTLSLADAAAPIAWAREGADGAIEVVLRTTNGFSWQAEGSAPVALDNAAGQQLVFDDALDAFVLRGVDGSAIVWAPRRAMEQRIAAAAPPEGANGWLFSGAPSLPFAEVATPNPAYTPVRIPQRYVVSTVAAGALKASDARRTPCADHLRCRALGESYLLGTIDAATPLAVYVFWSWDSLAALFAAPLVEAAQ